MRKHSKICHICEYPPPPGGMTQQAELLAFYLENEGFHVRKCKTNFELPFFFKPYEKKLPIKLFVRFPLLLWQILKNVFRCDIVHVFSIAGVGGPRNNRTGYRSC